MTQSSNQPTVSNQPSISGQPPHQTGGVFISTPVLVSAVCIFVILIVLLIQAHRDLWASVGGIDPSGVRIDGGSGSLDTWSADEQAKYEELRKKIEVDFERMNAELLEQKREIERLRALNINELQRMNQAQLEKNQSQYDSLVEEARALLDENILMRQDLEAGHSNTPDATDESLPDETPVAQPPVAEPAPTR